jgi:predicted RNase H-like HicB family nuclease|tara:strand:- start:1027 stop:1200 length:174 start_codon:yes stop_codon:yes gene_type:complete
MNYEYEIEYRDQEGDTYEESFTNLSEAKKFIKEQRAEGNEIIQTWRYLDGEYKGAIR